MECQYSLGHPHATSLFSLLKYPICIDRPFLRPHSVHSTDSRACSTAGWQWHEGDPGAQQSCAEEIPGHCPWYPPLWNVNGTVVGFQVLAQKNHPSSDWLVKDCEAHGDPTNDLVRSPKYIYIYYMHICMSSPKPQKKHRLVYSIGFTGILDEKTLLQRHYAAFFENLCLPQLDYIM